MKRVNFLLILIILTLVFLASTLAFFIGREAPRWLSLGISQPWLLVIVIITFIASSFLWPHFIFPEQPEESPKPLPQQKSS
jgi:hypothetical protein